MALPAIPLLGAAIWGTITAFVARLIPFIIKKVFRYLGIAYVTYVGVSSILSEVAEWVYSKYTGLPSDALAILDLFGVYDVIGMYIGALTSIVAYRSAQAALRLKRDQSYIT